VTLLSGGGRFLGLAKAKKEDEGDAEETTDQQHEQEPSPPRPPATVSACRSRCCRRCHFFDADNCGLVHVVDLSQKDLVGICRRGAGTVAESSKRQRSNNSSVG